MGMGRRTRSPYATDTSMHIDIFLFARWRRVKLTWQN